MNGINMMLKSFGIDPEQIKAELTTTLNNATGVVKTEVQNLHTKIDTLQRTANRNEQMLSAILKHLGIAGIGGAFDNNAADKVGTQHEERMITDGGINSGSNG